MAVARNERLELRKALESSSAAADELGAHATARVLRSALPLLESGTLVGERLRTWENPGVGDAIPVRLAGALHHLLLSGQDERLAPVYAEVVTEQQAVDALVLAMVRDHDSALVGWFDSPPQTNEAARSGAIMAALLWLSGRLGPRFELNEIGASAGINTMMDRFAFDLGGVQTGAAGSSLRIAPEWRGPPPPANPVVITEIKGCDLSPINLADPVQALRLKSYVWPDKPERLARLDAAIAMAQERTPHIEQASADDWVAARLTAPQQAGVTRVFYHSLVWLYLPHVIRSRIEAEMIAAGRRATPERPLAWLAYETDMTSRGTSLRLRYWPGGEAETVLADVHSHGEWVTWRAE